MEVLVKIAQLLLSLSILVVLHEFGHFAFAKLFKTRVEKFYLFFNPWFSIFKVKYGETEYGMGWLPLGGYVKISGMIDESMDKEQMKLPPQPYEFRSKPAWQRLLIMVGGVLMNFILACVIFGTILFVWGKEYLPNDNVKYGIVAESAAIEAGLQNGDKILLVEGEEVEDFADITTMVLLDDARRLTVLRDGQTIEITVPESAITNMVANKGSFLSFRFPFVIGGFSKNSIGKENGLLENDQVIAFNGYETPYFDQFFDSVQNYKNQNIEVTVLRNGVEKVFSFTLDETGLIGAAPSVKGMFDYEKIEYGFVEAIPAGVLMGYDMSKKYLKQFKLIFRPETEAYKSVGSFVTIGNMFPGFWDWRMFWFMTAFLSIMLAIINILPIPALDGGHVMFLLYEMVVGKKASEKVMEYAQIVGMVLLLALLVFALKNDIVNNFF
jgi:regulator of sigma E protease